MRRPIFLFFLIIILAITAVFTYPKFPQPFNWLENKLPWKLGLDLIGGTQLVYEIDMNQVAGNDRDSVVSGLRDVIEKKSQFIWSCRAVDCERERRNSYRLIIELAGIKDVKSGKSNRLNSVFGIL